MSFVECTPVELSRARAWVSVWIVCGVVWCEESARLSLTTRTVDDVKAALCQQPSSEQSSEPQQWVPV